MNTAFRTLRLTGLPFPFPVRAAGLLVFGLAAWCQAETVPLPEEAPVRGIQDNSFFVEEAYNQEAGVVQHILGAGYRFDRVRGSDARGWDMTFTQEWPVPDQTHQLSYTIPYTFEQTTGARGDGVGDVLLNYRWQAYFDETTLTAFAPRFSLILPTGDAAAGYGDDTVGFQWNLPFSRALGSRWFVHANAGLTFLPEAGLRPSRTDLVHYQVAGSAIYAMTRTFHLMLESTAAWQETSLGGGGGGGGSPATRRDLLALIAPGARYAINLKSGAQMVIGAAVPLGLTGAAPDYGAFLYFSFESALWHPKD